jgi:hypothetical protein
VLGNGDPNNQQTIDGYAFLVMSFDTIEPRTFPFRSHAAPSTRLPSHADAVY